MTDAFLPKELLGIPSLKFNKIFDRYTWGDGVITADDYMAMSDAQKDLIQTIKRSKKRVNK